MEHPLFLDYGPVPGWAILLALFGVSGGFFGYQVWKASKLVLVGKPENRFDNWGARVSEVLSGWLGQKKVLKDRIAGGIHVLMFWGFLMLSTDMFDLASGNQFSQKVLPEFIRGPWNLMVEVATPSPSSVACWRCCVAWCSRLRNSRGNRNWRAT